MTNKKFPPVFSYTDYKAYLKDIFAVLKKEDPKFSYRAFAKMAGSSAPNFLQFILAGKLSPSESAIANLARSLELNRNEAKFLRNLVGLSQAKNPKEKQAFQRRLLESQKGDPSYIVTKAQYEYYSKWYHSAIRALIGYARLKKGQEDYRRLAKLLTPVISPAQAKQSLALLLRLHLIEVDPFGYYRQSNAVISTGSGFRSMEVLNFQRETMQLAQQALESCPSDLRDISTLTLNISEKGFAEMRQRIRDFRKEMIELARRDAADDRVYQLNLQLFPLSKTQR